MGVIQARDLSKHVIRSAVDGLDLVKRATANRRVSFYFVFGVALRGDPARCDTQLCIIPRWSVGYSP